MEQLESDDYFHVLGLARDASDTDVRRAYKRLAVQWHPDKNRSHPRAEEFFKKIAEAYAVLSDPEQRRRYEQFGTAQVGRDVDPESWFYGGAPAFDPFAYGVSFSARHAFDIFEAFFGGGDPIHDLFHQMGAGDSRRHRRSRDQVHPMADVAFGGMAFGGMSDMGIGSFGFDGLNRGGGSMAMMEAFFGDNVGSFGSGAGGIRSSFSTSVSSSTFTDRNGHVVTKKTSTTVDASGNSETVTEEFRNGKLTSSTSSSMSRLANAGQMQMQLQSGGGEAMPSVAQVLHRGTSSRSGSRRGANLG